MQGSCAVSGSFAYAAQEPWIFNATLQENILFGAEMDEERYQDAIYACALTQDLEILTHGDMTEVSDNRVSLIKDLKTLIIGMCSPMEVNEATWHRTWSLQLRLSSEGQI